MILKNHLAELWLGLTAIESLKHSSMHSGKASNLRRERARLQLVGPHLLLELFKLVLNDFLLNQQSLFNGKATLSPTSLLTG